MFIRNNPTSLDDEFDEFEEERCGVDGDWYCCNEEPIVFEDREALCKVANHKFLKAAEEDDEATFEKVLRECPDLDVNFVEDPRCPQAKSVACGRSPLWWAVKNNNIRMVRSVVEDRRDIDGSELGNTGDWSDPGCKSPFMLACSSGFDDIVRALLSRPRFKSRVNQPNEYGKTALHYAASSGTPETVYALIGDPIINVNARNYLGWTPLHCAVYWHQLENVDVLLRCKRTRPNMKAKDGTTALDLAEKELQRYIDLHPDEEPTQKFNDIIDIIDLIKERMSGETRAERLNGISTC